MAEAWLRNFKKSSKAARTDRQGNVHDSKAELLRWEELQLQSRAGMIRNLERQKAFPLILPNGVPIKVGTRTAQYTPDFCYDRSVKTATGTEWQTVVEDVKGVMDRESRLRIAVYTALYGQTVTVIKYETRKGFVKQ